jgi:VWFA-related protein
MKYRFSALSLAAACLCPILLHAQAKPTDVYVSVLDNKGEPVAGLTAPDFSVREDGVAREVLKAGPATEPLTVALLVDDSQASSSSILMIREGVQNFIKALAGKAEISLITFGERPTTLVDFTTDEKRLQNAANRIFARPGAGAYMTEAVQEASRALTKKNAARPVIAVLMLEDVEFSNLYYEQVLTDLDKSRAALHVLSLGQPQPLTNDELRNRAQVIANGTERTGGRREQLLAATAIPGKMTQLANDLLHQYVVTYARPERLLPPERIEVTVTKPGLTVHARTRTGQVGAR